MTAARVGFLLTHPIQYYAPLFRYLAQHAAFGVHVYYQSCCSVAGYFDANFGRHVAWDNDLLAGYAYEFLPSVGGNARLGYWRPWCFGLRRRLLRDGVTHLVIAGYNRPLHWVAVWVAWRLGVKIWIRDDSNSVSKDRSGVKVFLKRWFFRGVAALNGSFLAVGQANLAYFLAHGIRRDSIHMLHWAVDTEMFRAAAEGRAAWLPELRRTLGIGADQFVLLFAGKLIAQKGIAVLLEAFLLAHGRSACKPALVVVGDGGERDAVRAAARGCADVKWVGFKNQSELPLFYALCDVLVLPSTNFESWGLVVNEAMSVGKPAIVSNRVGCGADLVTAATGWVAKAGDAESLAARMVEAMGAARDGRYREACLERMSHYNFRANLAQLNTLLAA